MITLVYIIFLYKATYRPCGSSPYDTWSILEIELRPTNLTYVDDSLYLYDDDQRFATNGAS